MRGCPFCATAAGEAAAEIICEDDLVSAFLDLHPLRPGHTRIIPRRPCFEALPAPTAARIFGLGQRRALALKERFPVARAAFRFTGGDSAHAHAHLVPMRDATDITSPHSIAARPLTFRSPPRASPPELARTGSRLRRTLGAVTWPPRPTSPGKAP